MDNTEKTHINFVLEAEQRYNTHEVRVSIETAKMLQKVGFDWDEYYCAEYPNGKWHLEIPLHIAQRWLREVKGVEIEVQRYESPHPVARELFETLYDKVVKRKFAYSVNVLDENDESLYDEQDFYTYESALEAGIKKALELILEKGE